MNLYHGKRLGWAYRRGLVDRDSNNTWIGHTATVLLFVLLGTAFFWVPVVLSAIAVAALLAGPAAFIFCLIAAPIGFAIQRQSRARERANPRLSGGIAMKPFVYWDREGRRYETPFNVFVWPDSFEFAPVDRCLPYRNGDTSPQSPSPGFLADPVETGLPQPR